MSQQQLVRLQQTLTQQSRDLSASISLTQANKREQAKGRATIEELSSLPDTVTSYRCVVSPLLSGLGVGLAASAERPAFTARVLAGSRLTLAFASPGRSPRRDGRLAVTVASLRHNGLP